MPTFPRRIILEHTTGPFAGLVQILGHSDELHGADPNPVERGIVIRPSERVTDAHLVSLTRTYIHYREGAPEVVPAAVPEIAPA